MFHKELVLRTVEYLLSRDQKLIVYSLSCLYLKYWILEYFLCEINEDEFLFLFSFLFSWFYMETTIRDICGRVTSMLPSAFQVRSMQTFWAFLLGINIFRALSFGWEVIPGFPEVLHSPSFVSMSGILAGGHICPDKTKKWYMFEIENVKQKKNNNFVKSKMLKICEIFIFMYSSTVYCKSYNGEKRFSGKDTPASSVKPTHSNRIIQLSNRR